LLEVIPGGCLVERLVDAAVVADEHVLVIYWIDGQRVVVGMNFLAEVLAPCDAAVFGDDEDEAEEVDAQCVGGVDTDLAEVEWARVEIGHTRPVVAGVARAEDAAGLALIRVEPLLSADAALHDREDDPRISGVDREADAAGLRRQAVGEL